MKIDLLNKTDGLNANFLTTHTLSVASKSSTTNIINITFCKELKFNKSKNKQEIYIIL